MMSCVFILALPLVASPYDLKDLVLWGPHSLF